MEARELVADIPGAVGEIDRQAVRGCVRTPNQPDPRKLCSLDRRRRVRILENAKHDPDAHATAVFAGTAGIGYELDTLGEHRVLAIPFFSGRKPLGAGTDVVELNPIPMAGASLADRERQAGTPRLTGFLPVSPVHGPADISPGTSRNGFRCRLCDGRMYHVDDLQSGPEAQERR